ncbi:MAG: hypothetical protein KBA31_02130 [Alphaproteobacteria bacterium]|nr:hypothetical protein [Alphaproteobacteria bacterium]
MGWRTVSASRLVAFAVFLTGFLLGGCASDRGAYEGPNGGFVVASVAVRSDTLFSIVRLDVRRRGGGDEGLIFYANDPLLPGPKADFDTAASRGAVGSVRVAPGEYELYNFLASYGNTDYSAKQDFSIPFTVDAGGITYIGEYTFAAIYGENFFGMTVPAGPLLSIADQQARDIAVVRARLPEAAAAKVRTAVPDPRQLNLPFFPPTPPPIHQR